MNFVDIVVEPLDDMTYRINMLVKVRDLAGFFCFELTFVFLQNDRTMWKTCVRML